MDPNNTFANPTPQPTPQNPPNPPAVPPAAPVAPAGGTDPKTQILERLKGSVNVLVTVSNNPSVDQLSAAIGFTLVLNKLKKHGTAVFSGQIPSTIEFLQPDKTIERNTDSLRDFIVALDKAKADKLRYKIEDKFVKIFITPYHTSLSEKDLEFGQGDLNVDVIVALGVNHRDQLDQAVTAHGRILHDATIISITRQQADDIGTINWHVPNASSFSEVLVDLSESMKSPGTELFDQQIATAFLTGIVAETDRFSNDKTTPQTMSVSAILMKAGANQQLIANKLEEPEPIPEVEAPKPVASSMPAPAPAPVAAPPKPNDGSLEIPHEDPPAPAEPEEPAVEEAPDIHIDDEGRLSLNPEDSTVVSPSPSGDMLPPVVSSSSASATAVNRDDQTLEDIERSVNSPHLGQPDKSSGSALPSDIIAPSVPGTPVVDVPEIPAPAPDLPDSLPHLSEEEARKMVEEAENSAAAAKLDDPTKPIAALNSVPVDLNLGHDSTGGALPPAGSNPQNPPAAPPPPPMAPPFTPPAP